MRQDRGQLASVTTVGRPDMAAMAPEEYRLRVVQPTAAIATNNSGQ